MTSPIKKNEGRRECIGVERMVIKSLFSSDGALLDKGDAKKIKLMIKQRERRENRC
jgi:hypothetical protein